MEGIPERLQRQHAYYEEIAPSVWLMNNHKWALLGWELSCTERSVQLVHLDWHWDGINDFDTEESQQSLRNLDTESLEGLIQEDRIKRASFIAPAVIRGVIDEIHFYCFQEHNRPGLSENLLESSGASQFMHGSLSDLTDAIAEERKPLIFDLDLDLFNRESPYYAEGSELEKSISFLISECKSIIASAEVVTLAKSPTPGSIGDGGEWDWEKELADDVADLVVPKVLAVRE